MDPYTQQRGAASLRVTGSAQTIKEYVWEISFLIKFIQIYPLPQER